MLSLKRALLEARKECEPAIGPDGTGTEEDPNIKIDCLYNGDIDIVSIGTNWLDDERRNKYKELLQTGKVKELPWPFANNPDDRVIFIPRKERDARKVIKLRDTVWDKLETAEAPWYHYVYGKLMGYPEANIKGYYRRQIASPAGSVWYQKQFGKRVIRDINDFFSSMKSAGEDWIRRN